MNTKQVHHAHNFLSSLFAPGDIIEIRGLGEGGSCSALFDNLFVAAKYAVWLNDKGINSYYTLNPIKRDSRVGRSHVLNMPKFKSYLSTRDEDIARVSHVAIDIDSVHPKGVSATTAEKAYTVTAADQIEEYLGEHGWPSPIRVDTGNGIHLIFHAEPGFDAMDWMLMLRFLADKFDSPHVTIDRAVWNPSRVMRLPGCFNRKGEPSEERPHRIAKVISYPESTELLGIGKVRKLAYTAFDKGTARRTDSSWSVAIDEDGVDQLFAEFPDQLQLVRTTHSGDETWYALAICPFKGEAHTGMNVGKGKTCLVLGPDRFGFACFNNVCSGHTISDLKGLLHEQTGRWPSMAFYEDDLEWWDEAMRRMPVEDVDPEYVVADDDEDEQPMTTDEFIAAMGIERGVACTR